LPDRLAIHGIETLGKKNMTLGEVVGVWGLVSFERRTGNGEISYPFGPSAVGRLIYDRSGYMSAALMSGERPALGMPPENVKGMRPSFLSIRVIHRIFTAAMLHSSYSGRYRIEGDTIIHQIEVSSLADWTGTELRRSATIENGQLALRFADAQGAEMTLRWKRLAE